MKSIKNKVQLIGNLGNNPVLKTLNSGKKLVRFSLATSASYKGQSGEKIENTQWHTIVAWENLADISVKLFKKGCQVAVEGQITYREYDDENGTKRHITEIIANEILLLSNKKNFD